MTPAEPEPSEAQPSQSRRKFIQPWVRALLAAIQLLTRLPVPAEPPRAAADVADDMRRGLIFFPAVGALVGLLAAVALAFLALLLPWPAAVIAALAVEARITGAFHEDAVADVCDGLGGGATPARVLEIMKDSRIGAYGALGLGLAVALRAAGLIALDSALQAGLVLVVAGAVGRLLIVTVMAVVPPLVDHDGLASRMAASGRQDERIPMRATLLVAAPVLAIGLVADPISMAAAALTLTLFGVWFRETIMRRIGGYTGDCLGFAAYVGIVVTTLAFARVT